MTVKNQQVAKPQRADHRPLSSVATSRVRGSAGNHTLKMQTDLGSGEQAEDSGQKAVRVGNQLTHSRNAARGRDHHGDGPVAQAWEERAAELFAEETANSPSSVSLRHSLPVAAAPVPEASRLSPAVNHMLSSSSRPLQAQQRDRFEALLGHSLGGVRLHLGGEADAAVRSAHAHAVTVGSHVGFASGRYAPGTVEGDRTLAHELAHVAQQMVHGPARVRYLTPEWVVRAVKLLPYARLFERIEAKVGIIEPFPRDVLLLMRDLAVALVDRDVPGVKQVVARLVPALNEESRVVHSSELREVVVRLIGDTIDLELFDEARQLRKAFTAQGEWVWLSDRGQEYLEHTVYYDLVNRLVGELNLSGPEAAETDIYRLLRVFQSMATELPRYRGIDNDWESLLKKLSLATLEAFQVLLDSATAELEAAGGTTRELTRAREVLGRMYGTIMPHYPVETTERIDVTRSDFEAKTGAKHLDYYRRDRKAPWVGITAYSRTNPEYKEKSLGLRRLLEIRVEQLEALEQMFGQARDQKGQITASSRENAEAMAAIGGFRLNDNESWRNFTLEKFRRAKLRLGEDGAALSATIDVLRTYLRAFTIHTPNNIDDFGEEYLSKTFPRALTGQLIHDCGVYALRIAYALSLVRNELDLDFQAIILPVHVGLIISFKKRNHPVFIVHNNDLAELGEDELKDLREQWMKSKGLMTMRFEREDFLAHIAAGSFVPGVDLPYRLESVPDVPKVADTRKRHRALWDFYLKKVVSPEVLRPAGGEAQPELLYLEVLEWQRELHDKHSVPLWRKGFEWWKRHENLLEQARQTHKPESTAGSLVTAPQRAAANLMFREEIRPHWEELWNMSSEWRTAIVYLEQIREAVAAFIKANPEALHPKAHMTKWGKFVMPLQEEKDFWEYVGDPGSATDRKETDSGVAFEKVVTQGNSQLLKGEILPPWWRIDRLIPSD